MPHHVVVYQINSLEDYLPDLMDLEVKVVVNLMVVDKIQEVDPKEEEVEVHHQEINLQEKVHLLKEEVEEEIDLRCVNEEEQEQEQEEKMMVIIKVMVNLLKKSNHWKNLPIDGFLNQECKPRKKLRLLKMVLFY